MLKRKEALCSMALDTFSKEKTDTYRYNSKRNSVECYFEPYIALSWLKSSL